MTGLYRPLEFFAVRAPALPLEALASLAAGAIPQADLVDEAIAVASPALSDARGRLAERPAEDGRRAERAERVERTVLRYASRMSTRPTPFGLFAGVGTGRFGAPTSLSLGPVASWRKRTRPDMAWLLGVVKALERRPDVQAVLRVVASGAAQRVGPRLVLPFSSAWGAGDAGEQPRTNVSVRASPPVLRALELAGEWESAGSLVDALAADFPAAGRPRIEKLVAGLVENEFLITELVPPAGDPAPLDHVVATLERIPAAVEDLRALERLRARLAEYDGVAPGEGLERLGGITALMAEIAPAEKLVQVDMTFSEARVTLPESIGWDVAGAAERLWRLGTPVLGLPHLRPWHLAFLERYGLGREVPVLEALSDEVGIGPPATYTYPAGDSPPPEPPAPSTGSERGRLAGHVVAALLQGHEELELTDELVEELSPDPDTSTAPASLELFAEIVAGSADDIDRGAYEVLLSPSLSSYGVGKASGRFGDLLGAPLMDQMASHYRREEAAGAPALFAELTHIPPAGRLANLTLVPCVRRFELPVGVAPSGAGSEPIALDDVLVCASAERLHLRSRLHGRELYVTAAHMVNLHLVPNVCRFLVEVFFEGVRLPGAIDWDPSLRLPRLPRVRHGRVIVAPASWNLYRHMLPEDDGSAESWAGRFRAWCAEWSVPGRVQLVMADQRLVLDLSVDAHLDPIRREFRSRGHACLAELPGGLAGRALRGPEGGHAMECVVAVERQGLGAAAVREEPPRPVIQAAVGNRIRGPGSDWLYL
ncbi:MAG: lantibiotic biosynthesis protein, partial [Thermoleophilaceae bacterium]|nr:lantibiotic biosynthesis protein [Thermoleophilaceae bacterium]